MWERHVAAALLALVSSGCAFTASAFANHNSHGTACVDNPAFGVIDLIIAGAAAGGMAYTDASPGYYTVPGVFGVSGLVGIAFAAHCASSHEKQHPTVIPATNSAPAFGDAPVDPTLRDATPEDRGVPMIAPPSLPATFRVDGNGIPTTLPSAPPVEPTTPSPGPPGVTPPAAPTCTITPRQDCPTGFYCELERENHGTCVQMR